MRSIATRRDHILVSIIGAIFGLLCLPILENIRPPQWELTLLSAAALILGFTFFANLALAIAGLVGARYPAIFQFAKYAATGAMNSFTDIGILNLFSLIFSVFAGPLLILFNVISFSIAVTNSYFWNNLWVFRNADGSGGMSFGQFSKFLGVTVSGVMINTAILYGLTTLIGAPSSVSPQLWENFSKLVAVPVSVIWNFFGYKFFVFGNKPAGSIPQA